MGTKIVVVTYTARPDYVSQNSANIQQVMTDLRALSNPGIVYFACLGTDGKTFTHTAFFSDDDAQKALFALPAFQAFQSQLKASMPEVPPQQALPTLVGTSASPFGSSFVQ